ncbi:hypothetical protein TWF192_000231 [Orbilia oligospora]|nr:hypothetical protein TWF192_000231 [Orbilia oligospora]
MRKLSRPDTASQGVAIGATYQTTQVVRSSHHEIDRYAERNGLGRLSGVNGGVELSIFHFCKGSGTEVARAMGDANAATCEVCKISLDTPQLGDHTDVKISVCPRCRSEWECDLSSIAWFENNLDHPLPRIERIDVPVLRPDSTGLRALEVLGYHYELDRTQKVLFG